MYSYFSGKIILQLSDLKFMIQLVLTNTYLCIAQTLI